MIETLREKNERLAAEKRQEALEESSRRQGSQIDRLNREAGQRNGERFALDSLLEDEREIVTQLRAAGANPELEMRLAEVQQEIQRQARKVAGFDRAYVEGLGLATE